MKKLLLIISCFYLVVFVAMLSCTKGNYRDTGTVIAVSAKPSPNKLFAGLRYTPQTLHVTAGRDTIVFGAKGTMFHFYTYSFRSASGAPITSGTVDLQLVEMLKPGDMIANRAGTLAGSQLLQSGGQVSVIASMGGQTVFANKYGIGFPQAGPSAQAMQMFAGNNNNGDSITNWAVAALDSMNGTVANGADTSFAVTNAYGRPWVGYVFDSSSSDSSSSMQYTNCDAFYNATTPLVSVGVIMPDTSFNPNTTEVFLVLPTINCVMSTIEPELGSAGYNAATGTISIVSEGNSAIVPSGMTYKIVIVAIKNGQYYYFTQAGTIPASGILAPATMAPQTQSYVAAQLAAL